MWSRQADVPTIRNIIIIIDVPVGIKVPGERWGGPGRFPFRSIIVVGRIATRLRVMLTRVPGQ